MKRPMDNFKPAQKMTKIGVGGGLQGNNHQQQSSYSSSSSSTQGMPSHFRGNLHTPSTLQQSQNPMPSYFMGNPNSYYPGVMHHQDVTNNLYSGSLPMGLNTWQLSQHTSRPPPQAMFDTTRPPPPPLPSTPAPEKPPLPPMPQDKMDTLSPPSNSFYRGRGGFATYNNSYRRGFGKFRGGHTRGAIAPSSTSPPVASQPPPSGLVIKTPATLNGQMTVPTIENAKQHRFNGNENKKCDRPKNQPIIHKKKRRKPMSERLPTLEWKREDAQRVLDLEKEYHAKRGDKAVIVRFPDPKLDYEVVKSFSSSIESVHFQQPAAARSCIIHLKKGSDVKDVCDELNKTAFGQGLLTAEPKRDEIEDEELAVEDIDPYTLYIGNFPSDVNVDEVKAMFPAAKKVDVGYAQKMKVTRYGFARYTNVDDAIEAYKANFNALYKSRSIIVRFRRNNRSIGLDGDRKAKKKDEKPKIEKKCTIGVGNNTTDQSRNNTNAFENDSEYGDGENIGEGEIEDTKDGVFDYANVLDNWLSDEVEESDDNEEEDLPNLTGLIKNEPDDFNEFFGVDGNDYIPSSEERLNQNIDKEKNSPSTSQNRNSDRLSQLQKISPSTSARSNDSLAATWEEIRQRELNEREEKPDIRGFQMEQYPPSPLKQYPPPPSMSQPLRSSPITSYGLVPMILPKQEKCTDDDERIMRHNNKEIDKDFEDFENAFDQEDDVDAAFENAWNELSESGS